MNVEINKLVKSLLQKNNLEECSIQELEQYADRHPYFGAAQLLLTKKLQLENSGRYDEQLQKTFLFFHNPLWVKRVLDETGNDEIIPLDKTEAEPSIVDISNKSMETEKTEIPVIADVETKEPEKVILDSDGKIDVETEIKENTQENDEPALKFPELKIEPIDPSKTDFVFEPFHTVDYFASQGINFKEDETPKDKFGLQLKSFTEWLKTMKRLPVSEIEKKVEDISEKKVEQMAQHSLAEKEVLTEAMAGVWEKQGNIGKAIEVYSKLSLLEPSKSLYFAAKIEDLKNKQT